MGLDAFVRCRCWQDGLTSEPPVPRALIAEDAEGYLDLTIPYEGNEELHHAFGAWVLSGACPHEDMEQAMVRVSNWSGYRAFQETLRQAGCERFPVLCAELPNGNGGSMEPELAARALDELAHFRQGDLPVHETRLVDAETGGTLATHIAGYRGVFVWDGSTGHQAGVDPRGFFVRDLEEPHEERFRAVRLAQKRIADRQVEFTDLDRGTTTVIELSGPIGAEPDGTYPGELKVVTERVTAAAFAYILEPLTTVFSASVEIGNPVMWT
ncbi:hypothetical protein J4573_08120 [Actinomadura barringtoniae]|uniref:Uncharacterized protein n=1 Tax=Actinomadura barringtoniae TaxID=1427535 RepID=A0A939T5F9_9ACTN|nr:hypothetical protein [Actinomadura barringtoniae]MBO2447052.1 hypothetical protein [Actinomadura barringtoniae]